VTEPTPAVTSDLVVPETPSAETPPASSGAASAEPQPVIEEVAPIPGERLPPPLDATRSVPDYGRPRPSYVFLALVSIVTLAADVASKAWAERHLEGYPGTVEVWKNHVTLLLAKNRGGAWGLLQSTSENVRRPFFLLVSVAAIAFIMTLYRRLLPRQHALKWGLPLVLGGALGNVFDRIRYGHVIDFIDMHVLWKGVDHHWPTYNVADIAICVGVGLMAIDMFTSKRGRAPVLRAPQIPPSLSGEPAADLNGIVVAAAPGSALEPLPPAEPADGGALAPGEAAAHEEVAARAESAVEPPPAEEPPTQ
jgi:lipoprotein signal peptidase